WPLPRFPLPRSGSRTRRTFGSAPNVRAFRRRQSKSSFGPSFYFTTNSRTGAFRTALVGPLNRQPDFELRALPGSAADFNPARVRLHDAVGQRQSQSGTLATGGEERLEDPWQGLPRNPPACIRDLHNRI